jgi:hypothetical protein
MHRIILKLTISRQLAHKVTTFLHKTSPHNTPAHPVPPSTVTINNISVVANEDSVVEIISNLQGVASEVVVISRTCTGMPMVRVVQVEASILETPHHNMAPRVVLPLPSFIHRHSKLVRSKLPKKTVRRMTIPSGLRKIYRLRIRRRR